MKQYLNLRIPVALVCAGLMTAWGPVALGQTALELAQQWQTQEAALALDTARLEGESGFALDFAELLIHYHRGDYARAQTVLDRADRPERFAPYDELVPEAIRQRTNVVEHRSAHFIVRVRPGLDEVLTSYVLETLELAYETIGDVLDYHPTEPALVEIFPDRQSFTRLSTLSWDQVSRSGTIALCKWDHMLVISPRATRFGYDWRDTLVHEYVHLVVARRSKNQAPVWFHEGLAAFLEGRWRGEPGGTLEPSGEALLARAIRNDDLIPLSVIDRDSMPGLPDAASVSLAFAEVTTAIMHLVDRKGLEVLPQLLDDMAAQRGIKNAIAAAYGSSFENWEADWKSWVARLPLHSRVDLAAFGIEFGDIANDDGAAGTDAVLEKDTQAQKLVRLGDLLMERQRVDAAIVEYERARKNLALHSPAVANRHSEALLSVNRAKEARVVMEESVDAVPGYGPSWVRLARTYDELGMRKEALRAWERARDINPFHPLVHQRLIELLSDGPQRQASIFAVDQIAGRFGHEEDLQRPGEK